MLRFLARLVVGLLLFSLLWAGAYRFVDPPLTYLMARDALRGESVKRQWVDLDDIARHLPRAVIAAEDARFCSHHGFDMEAIEKAMERNREGGRLRGGSTISQQTAKNAFLWPGRTMVRKGAEAWFTALIELLWGKRRIMEVYLNVAEFGRGVYGAEAAARHYFDKPASRLTRQEAARLAAILPQPVKRDAARPGPYTRRYAGRIESRSRVVANEGLDACLWR
ncbi:monofunctional biosynthetic peptidoglycan transglycosylase [Sandaracinobacteroides sp. A072]|uniref:monofunctional biosynthetic peptidoglycan transglycosylase n=1 Tax=Sandaracinobacteroides sp. A072 TaxID=3461146 RepID=UPI0040419FFC